MVCPTRDRLEGLVHFGKGRIRGCKTSKGFTEEMPVLIAAEERWGELRRTRIVVASDASEDRLREFVRALTSFDPVLLAGGIRPVVRRLGDWLPGPHLAGVSPNHPPYYLDEFTFRFNHRIWTGPKQLFRLLAKRAVAIDPAPYKTLIKPK